MRVFTKDTLTNFCLIQQFNRLFNKNIQIQLVPSLSYQQYMRFDWFKNKKMLYFP